MPPGILCHKSKIIIILIAVICFLPTLSIAELPVKLFLGWSYQHQDDQIKDGSILWAIIKDNESYILTKRKIKLKSIYSPMHNDDGQKSGRKLIAPDKITSIIHFTDIKNLKEGPIFFKEIKKPLINTFNPKVPSSSIDFEFKGIAYRVTAELNKEKTMSIYLKQGTKKQTLCLYPKVTDALAWFTWVADIDSG